MQDDTLDVVCRTRMIPTRRISDCCGQEDVFSFSCEQADEQHSSPTFPEPERIVRRNLHIHAFYRTKDETMVHFPEVRSSSSIRNSLRCFVHDSFHLNIVGVTATEPRSSNRIPRPILVP